jgi:hypothetical protein
MAVPIDLMFPKAAAYRSLLLDAAGRVLRERPAGDVPDITERHMRCIWADQAFRPRTLATMRGETVTVESPGTWNMEPGPDFIDATLLIGPANRRVVGDVELHIRPSDWKHHRHGGDPAYRRVAAHVTWMPGSLPDGTLPPGAVEITLRDAVRSNPLFAPDAIDVTAYPFAVGRDGRRPCSQALAGWCQADRVALLESAGQERLRIKAVRMARAIADRNDPDQVLHEEVCSALGYKHNRAAFRMLASELPASVLRDASGGDAIAAYALMAGVSGLLPSRPPAGADDEARQFLRRVWDCWWKHESAFGRRAMPRSAWRLGGARPHNHPLRRMAAAAAFSCSPEPLARRLLSPDAGKPAGWFAAVKAFMAAGDKAFPFWVRHLCLAGPAGDRVAIVGPERMAAMAANIFVPFLAANGTRIESLLAAIPPEAGNSLVRRTAHALFGHDHNPAMYRNALAQQGLMQIAFDFCLNARKGCRECGLTDAILKAGGPGA